MNSTSALYSLYVVSSYIKLLLINDILYFMKQQCTKLSILREHIAFGRWFDALRLAASFSDLGEHRVDITRAHGCLSNPRFFAQIGDCGAAIEAGKSALIARYTSSK